MAINPDGAGPDPDGRSHASVSAQGEFEGENAAWAMLWILMGFKAFSIVLILALHTSPTSIAMMFWLNLPWFGLLAFMVGGLWLAYWRLWRVRLKRDRLVRSEWDVTSTYRERVG